MLRAAALITVGLIAGGAASATASSLITGKQVKNGTLTGRDVKDHSLSAKDFRGSVRGRRGAAGPAGPAGATGPQGPPGVVPAFLRAQDRTLVPDARVVDIYATCPAGTAAISGGYRFEDATGLAADDADVHATYSEPVTTAKGLSAWRLLVRNDSGRSLLAVTTATCSRLPAR